MVSFRAKSKLLLSLVALVLLFSASATVADEEGVDYGYWCTDCGMQHGPGESCPKQSAPAYSAPDEPYDWSQPTYAVITTTTDTSTSTDTSIAATTSTTLAAANANAHQRIKNIQPFGTSVVDLRDKKETLVVSPNDVKGKTAKPRSLKIKEPPAPGYLSDKELMNMIAEMLQYNKKASQVAVNKRIFEKNPDKYLTNPLRTMENDKEYVDARKRLVKEADKAIFEAELKLLEMSNADMRELWRKSGSRDFTEFYYQCDADPTLRKKSDAIIADYRAELQIVTLRCNDKLRAQMAAEAKKFYQRHPELKKESAH